MVTPAIGVGADFGYHGWGAKDEFIDAANADFGVTDADITLSAMQFSGHGAYVFPMANEKVMPYVKVGLGAYSSKAKLEATGVDEEETSTDFGFNVGGGVNFEVSPMYAVGINAAFHQIQTEEEATNLITVGVNLLFGVGGK
jgi:opacity protein-like surface antigen